jgi:hypothetical protein
MTDFIFLIIPLIIGGILARINSKAIANNIASIKKWVEAQINIFETKTGFGYRLVLLPIFQGFDKAFIQIDNIKNPGLCSGAFVAFLIYAIFFATFLLGVAVFFFIYTVGLLAITGLVLWILDKRNVFNKYPKIDLKNITPVRSTEVIDLNKEEELETLGEKALSETLKTEQPKLDEFGLPKKR